MKTLPVFRLSMVAASFISWAFIGALLCAGLSLHVLLLRLGPGREILGVDVDPGVWARLSFKLPHRRRYRLWACVSLDGEHRAAVAADLEVDAGRALLRSGGSFPVAAVRWWDSPSRFTLRLWSLPPLEAGTEVDVRVRLVGIDGTPVRAMRLYLSE